MGLILQDTPHCCARTHAPVVAEFSWFLGQASPSTHSTRFPSSLLGDPFCFQDQNHLVSLLGSLQPKLVPLLAPSHRTKAKCSRAHGTHRASRPRVPSKLCCPGRWPTPRHLCHPACPHHGHFPLLCRRATPHPTPSAAVTGATLLYLRASQPGTLSPQATLGKSEDSCTCHKWGTAAGILWSPNPKQLSSPKHIEPRSKTVCPQHLHKPSSQVNRGLSMTSRQGRK